MYVVNDNCLGCQNKSTMPSPPVPLHGAMRSLLKTIQMKAELRTLAYSHAGWITYGLRYWTPRWHMRPGWHAQYRSRGLCMQYLNIDSL